MTEEKRRKKKAFTLEFSKSYDDSISTSQDDWSKNTKASNNVNLRSDRNGNNNKTPEDKSIDSRKLKPHFVEKSKSVQSSPRETIDIEKTIKEKDMQDSKRSSDRERHVKRTKLKAKSPTQCKALDINYARPQHFDRRDSMGPNMKLHLNIPTSDDSSEQYSHENDGKFK